MTEPSGNVLETSLPWHRRAGLAGLHPADCHRLRKVNWWELDPASTNPQLAWLGHASFYLAWNGMRILIDPVFAKFVGIVPRRCPIPVNWQEMRPDLILLSHAHMDHMDMYTLGVFGQTQLLVPAGSERFLAMGMRGRARPITPGRELDFGDLRIRAVPALHGGWRYPWQRGCQALGYVISNREQQILYAGDTAFGDHFTEMANPGPNLALLPIGAYSPAWFLAKRHMNPEQALRAGELCRAKTIIPFHFGTYRLSLEPMAGPFTWFSRMAREKKSNWYLPVGI